MTPPLATWALHAAAGHPDHPDFTDFAGPCWWCGCTATGRGWPVALLPDTFPTPALARVKTSTHLCAACGWTLASGFALPNALAALRLTERAEPSWRGNRRTEVSVLGGAPVKHLILRLADGRIGLWTPATPKAAEDAWLATLDRQQRGPHDVGPVRFVGAHPLADLAPGRELRFFVWHHVTLPDHDGRPCWRPMTDAEKPEIRHHLTREDLDGDHLGATVLSTEKKHCAIYASVEHWHPHAPRVVWFGGQSITYRAPHLRDLIAAAEDLIAAGARDDAILSGRYPGDPALLTVLRASERVLAPARGGPLLSLALYLRRPRADIGV